MIYRQHIHIHAQTLKVMDIFGAALCLELVNKMQ